MGRALAAFMGSVLALRVNNDYEINLCNVYQTMFSKHFFLGRIYQIQIWPKVIQPRSSRWWRLKALPHLHFRFSLFHRLRLKTEAILRPSRETFQWRIPTVLLTWEMWWLQTPSSLKLLQRGRWTKRVTGELEEKAKDSEKLQVCIWPVLYGPYLPPSIHQTGKALGNRQHRSDHCVRHQGIIAGEYLDRREKLFIRICGTSLRRWRRAPWCWWAEICLHTTGQSSQFPSISMIQLRHILI